MRTVILGADRAKTMPPCRVCGEPKLPHQTLSIDADGKLIHKECKSGN